MKKKVLISMAIVLFLTTGCGKVPKLENGQDAVVTLDGYEVSVDSLYSEMKDRYALSVLLDMIDEDILNRKYEDDEEQKEAVESQIESWIQIYGRGSEATLLQQTTSAFGITTMEGLRDYLTVQYKRNLAVEDYAKTLVEDDEIQKYYDEKIFGDITAKHILIKPETTDSMTTDEKTAAEEAALKKANDLIKKLDEGADFEELAKENSDDEGTASKGGVLDPFGHGAMVTEFEEAALDLEDGEYTSEPVKSTYGYHIILRVSQKEKPQLKTVKTDIIDDLYKDKLKEDASIEITALEKLREEYKIDIHDKTLKSQYETYLTNAKNSANES